MFEQIFFCPYCNAQISMLLDESVSKQEYIEDCEVCCNPIKIYYKFEIGQLVEFSALSIEQ